MTLSLQDNKKIDRKQWQTLVSSSSTSSCFQTPEYYDFLSSLSFLEPFLFAVSEDNELKGVIVGYITSEKGFKHFFSRRAIIHGGVLMSPTISDEALASLLKHTTAQLSQKSIYIEIRNYFDYSEKKHVFEKNGFKYNQHLNFHVDTSGREEAFARLSSTKRRDIRITIQNGAEIIKNPSEHEITEYYGILSDLYINKIKLPLFPLEFFISLSKSEIGKFFITKYKDEVIGGSVCIGLNGILYEFFACGMDKKFKNIYPSTLATWGAIEYAAENGFKYFDMMGAGKPNDGYGVRNFKSKFGGKLVEYGRFIHICNKIMWRIGNIGLKAMKSIKKS